MIAMAFLALTLAATKPPTPSAPVFPSPKGPLASAQGWRYISFSDDTAVYMKRSDAPAETGVRQVWTAYDSSKARDRMGFKFMSVASLGEYDCQKGVSRVVRETFHRRRGLTGEAWVQPNFIPTQWASPGAGTVGEQRLAFACSRDAAPPAPHTRPQT